jgi:hypothetical protein
MILFCSGGRVGRDPRILQATRLPLQLIDSAANVFERHFIR